MTGLFLRTYLDEDVSVIVARMLRGRGFEAVTTQETGRLGQSDEAQLAFATASGLSLLTHNRADFDRLALEYHAAGRAHHGIIIAVRRLPQEITRRLLVILNRVTADELAGQVVYI